MNNPNPFLTLNYEPALESLGSDYFDEVAAAEFPSISCASVMICCYPNWD